jgi:hypothetical protein
MNALQVPLCRELPFSRAFFYMSLEFLIEVLLLQKKFQPSLKGPSKGASPPCSTKWGPYGNRHPFPEPYSAYPSGTPVKEPSLQVPLTELSQREMLRFLNPPSFVFQCPWYMSPLPGSPVGPLLKGKSPQPSFTYSSGSPVKEPTHPGSYSCVKKTYGCGN